MPKENDATQERREAAEGPSELHLVASGPEVLATHALAPGATFVLGRSEVADIRIDDPQISRQHARLHVGATLEIEDLGSANGVVVGNRRIAPGKRVEIQVGEGVLVGSTMIVVQRARVARRPRRIWSHGYFEGRLEDECARAARSDVGFTVLRVRVDGEAARERVAELFAASLRAHDVLAEYGPGELEALIVDAPAAEGQAVSQRIAGDLAAAGLAARVAAASFPRDGRDPEALVAQLTSSLRGDGRAHRASTAVRDEITHRLDQLVDQIAAGHINVLILGETGVGKEVVAETIHRRSPRARAPFVALSCAALPESLLENELFGHERGAFTGAVQAKPGLLETAEGGTVFLDEVGEMPLSIQAKLLRVIDTRQVLRLGGLRPRSIDVRFLAATNRNLEAEIVRGAFRQDLYFRLSAFALVVPPLRERVDEIEGLARAFVGEARRQSGRDAEPPRIAREVLDALRRYSWPGNIRELRNVMERAVLLSRGGRIELGHLPVEKMGEVVHAAPRPRPLVPPEAEPDDADSGDDRARVFAALERCAGNQTRAARLLGISRTTLVARLDRYGAPRPRKKE